MKKIYAILLFTLSFNLGFAQNGKIIAKNPINLAETSIWKRISENDTLTSKYQYLDKLNFYAIIYNSDGNTVKGMVVEPKKEGKYPVVIFNRGGNRTFSELNASTMIMYTCKLAEQGYVIIGSNYREKDEFGGAEINDVLCLTETVKEFDKADPNTIGMYGWSRGGMMTYLALQKSTQIKTAIVGNGPSDLFGVISDRPEMETAVIAQCVPDYSENKEQELRKRSAQFWADKLNKDSSLLILCGLNDDRVNPNQSIKMAEKLKEIHYNFVLKTFETDHFFSDKKAELDEVVIDWFNKELKSANAKVN